MTVIFPGAFERPAPLNVQNWTIVWIEVVGFGASDRNDEDRRIARRELFTMIRQIITDARLPAELCHWEDRGDGVLLLVPSTLSMTTPVAFSTSEIAGRTLRRPFTGHRPT